MALLLSFFLCKCLRLAGKLEKVFPRTKKEWRRFWSFCRSTKPPGSIAKEQKRRNNTIVIWDRIGLADTHTHTTYNYM